MLDDDRAFFPPYDAAALVSARLARDDPAAVAALAALSGRFTEAQLRAWNRAIEVDGRPIADVARDALAAAGLGDTRTARTSRATATAPGAPRASLGAFLVAQRADIARHLREHLALVAVALLAAIATAVPLALALQAHPRAAAAVLQGLGVLQTVPSLALLAFLLPLLGIGTVPALVALWGYALLPIARATLAGLRVADPEVVAAVEAMGATPRQALLQVRLPLAAPVVLAGIRTAAVLTVGTATLAAFIGAGGLGEPIVTGLGLADMRLVLSGAIPAALLAVVVDALLALAERAVRPAHLRGR